MWSQSVSAADDLCTIEADFFTEHFVLRGTVTTPENRLSDHLNGSTTTIEIQPSRIHHVSTGEVVNTSLGYAYVTKAHLLFIVPIKEPDRTGTYGSAWTRTDQYTCWAGLGRYSLAGRIYMEADRSPRLAMRSLEQRQFLPISSVRLSLPDGSSQEYDTILVNRFHLELLILT